MNKQLFSLLTLLLIFGNGIAQKKSVELSDFANWKSISSSHISNDGNWVSYQETPGHGDGELILKNISSGEERRFERGYKATFSDQSDLLVFQIKVPLDSLRKATIEKRKKDKIPKESLAILSLSTQKLVKFPKASGYKMPTKGEGWLAFYSEYYAPEDTLSKKKEKYLMVVQNSNIDHFEVKHVTEFTIAEEGTTIAALINKKDTTKLKQVVSIDVLSKEKTELLSDSVSFKKITIDNKGEQIAFLQSKDSAKVKHYSLNYAALNKQEIMIVTDSLSNEIQDKWLPSENGKISFSKNGKRLFFRVAPKQKEEVKDTLLKSEKAKVDVWSWTDKQLKPQQKLYASKEKKRTYTAIYHIKEKKVVQVADTLLKTVLFDKDRKGDLAFGLDNSLNERANSWDARWYRDYYKIDLTSGKKELLVKRIKNISISPEQNYGLFYNWKDSVYYGVELKSNKQFALTKELPVAFYDELHDTPSDPSSYGIAGWSNKGRYAYVYDRYDIWRLDLTQKSKPLCITQGKGREQKITYRYKKLDTEEQYISAEKEQLLSLFDEKSKKTGFATLRFDGESKLRTLFSTAHLYGAPKKAKYTDRLMLTRQSTQAYPDLYITDSSLEKMEQISDANPQQKEFNWMTSELVSWTSFQGEKLEGILILPENFDPKKKYPMISYFYERNTQYLNRYWMPSASRSVISKSFYASNAYIVFVPDITYTTGYPGQNAYDAVVSGVIALCEERPYIDKKRLGLQGQSWGGYQTAYLITRTNLFAAAMAGAPVSNMTSAYGGIRWGTGMSRMFQYEHTQSRIGGTLWDKPMQYIENSPVFFANKVETPLLIMHNDNDGAVPWYQGIEYFVALRRLDKPVWMLNYNREPHNLGAKSWGNRMDLSTRMFEFFNYYLKGEEAPKWMK